MKWTNTFRLLACSTTALMVACGGDRGTSPLDPVAPEIAEGSVSFNYSGAEEGTFSAMQAYEEDLHHKGIDQDHAVGIRTSDLFSLTAWTSGSNGRLLLNLVLLNASDTGSYPVCTEGEMNGPCSGFVFVPDLPAEGPASSGWQSSGGSVEVSLLSNSRMRGTFSGTLVHTDTGSEIVIAHGEFDVPVG